MRVMPQKYSLVQKSSSSISLTAKEKELLKDQMPKFGFGKTLEKYTQNESLR